MPIGIGPTPTIKPTLYLLVDLLMKCNDLPFLDEAVFEGTNP
jgi:hypothetical protein